MSILEKIVKTESLVQKNIKEAHEKANELVTNARKSGLEEAVLIKNEVEKKLEEIQKSFDKKNDSFENNLDEQLKSQHEEMLKTVNPRKDKVVLDIYNEVIKL